MLGRQLQELDPALPGGIVSSVHLTPSEIVIPYLVRAINDPAAGEVWEDGAPMDTVCRCHIPSATLGLQAVLTHAFFGLLFTVHCTQTNETPQYGAYGFGSPRPLADRCVLKRISLHCFYGLHSYRNFCPTGPRRSRRRRRCS